MLRIFDAPESGFQIHLHLNEEGHINAAKIVSYDRQAERALNSYEAAMADYSAKQIKLPKYDKDSD